MIFCIFCPSSSESNMIDLDENFPRKVAGDALIRITRFG